MREEVGPGCRGRDAGCEAGLGVRERSRQNDARRPQYGDIEFVCSRSRVVHPPFEPHGIHPDRGALEGFQGTQQEALDTFPRAVALSNGTAARDYSRNNPL